MSARPAVCTSHAHFTQRIEPALYRADVLRFRLALEVLARSGLVPGPEQLAAAFKRLAGHLRRRRERG